MSEPTWVVEAFPSVLRTEAAAVARRLPWGTTSMPGNETVIVSGDPVRIPYRVHSRGLRPDPARQTPTEQLVLHCLGTRDHDGHARERHLRAVVRDLSPWAVPYVVALAGEYVIEIVQVIEQSLTELTVDGSAQQRAYGSYLAANPRVLELTRSRVVSYWDCYFRCLYLSLDDHPAQRLVRAFERAARA